MSKEKVCMLTTHHSALDDRIFYKESISLQQAGYQIFLIAPLSDEKYLFDMSGSKIADLDITIQNIKIIGFENNKSRFNRIQSINDLILLTSLGKFSLGKKYLDLIEKAIELEADIYHCHEIWSLYAGILIKRRLQKKGKNPKLVYDVHEFHPANINNTKSLGDKLYKLFLRRVIKNFEKNSLSYTNLVLTVNQIIRGYLLTLNRFTHIEVLYNCPVLSIFKEINQKKSNKNDKIVICHEGFLLFRRGLKQIIEVMKILKQKYNDKVELLIIGDIFGKEKDYFNKKINEYKLQNNIKVTGWQPYNKVGEFLSQADIGIIFFDQTENNMLAGPPHKLFNYMRYGIPVISVDLPETSRIISKLESGIVIKNWNLDDMVSTISKLIEDKNLRYKLGANAKKAVYEHYNWNQMEKRLLKAYASIT
jgi:glycosyltransferase involved in cell wall biosynthesis